MSYTFICEQRRLFSTSERSKAQPLHAGELVSHDSRVYTIVDIEHQALMDGGHDRVRLSTLVYLQELDEQSLALRRSRQRQGVSASVPKRY